MDPNTNTMKNDTEPVLSMHSEFIKRKWKVVENGRNVLIYGKDGYPLDEFIIKTTDNRILVSVPIAKTNTLYTTEFMNCANACRFALMHLENVEKYHEEQNKKSTNNDDE